MNIEEILKTFDDYAEILDEQFNDGLIIEYQRHDKIPNFNIIYDPSIDVKQLIKNIPEKWRVMEREHWITITISKYK